MTALGLSLMVLLILNSAHAWLRFPYEDAIVVDRSELIVVAHLKEGAIQYVPHKTPGTMEHHATLVITEVLKGECEEKEIPIIVHFGLTPVVGGYMKRGKSVIDHRAGRDDYPKDIIEIFDTGGRRGGKSFVKDARQDNLWFLRKRSGPYGRKPGTGKYGIVDPEDLQPLNLKKYFLAYMADDPEAAVKEWAEKNPGKAGREKRYLDHLEVERILKVKDSRERYDKLLPFFLNRTTWNMKKEARNGIVSCGTVAGELLREVFDDPKHAEFRKDIIVMWRDIGYREAVPVLIDMLKKHDQFWAKQDLKKGWWNDGAVSREVRRRRHNTYSEVYRGVYALRSFKDARAEDVLKMTRDRWKAINFDNTQIVEECEAALRELSDRKGTSKTPAPGEALLVSRIRIDLPDEWQCTIETKEGQKGHPHGLDELLFRVDFSNPDKTFYDRFKGKLSPLIQLYFYEISSKAHIMRVIEKEKEYSWNIPIYFGETDKYIAVTSPPYVNHGVFTEDAKRAIRPIWNVLRKHIENKEGGNVDEMAQALAPPGNSVSVGL